MKHIMADQNFEMFLKKLCDFWMSDCQHAIPHIETKFIFVFFMPSPTYTYIYSLLGFPNIRLLQGESWRLENQVKITNFVEKSACWLIGNYKRYYTE